MLPHFRPGEKGIGAEAESRSPPDPCYNAPRGIEPEKGGDIR